LAWLCPRFLHRRLLIWRREILPVRSLFLLLSKLLELTAFPRFLQPAADLPVANQVPAGPPVPVPDPVPNPVPNSLPNPFLNGLLDDLLDDLLDSVLNGLPDDLADDLPIANPVANPVPVLKETLPVRSLLPLLSSLELTALPNLLRKSSLCDYFELLWKLKNEVQCCTCNCA